jgi:hypothetical protein
MCRTPSAHTKVGSIPDFLWSGVKLPIWLPAFLSTITYAVDVRMAHARPFSTSTLQGLFNGIKNTSRQGVLTLQSSSEVAGVPEDSKFSLSGVWVSSSHLPQSGVVTLALVPSLRLGLWQFPLNNLLASSIMTIPWNILMAFILKLWNPIPFHERHTYLNFLNWHLESRSNEHLHPTFVWGSSPYMHLGSFVYHLHQNNEICFHFHMPNNTL